MTDDDQVCGHCFKPIGKGEPSVTWALPADLLVGLVEWHPRCAVELGRELVADGEERALAHERWQALQTAGFTAPMTLTPTPTSPPTDPLETMPRERLWWALWEVLPAAMRGDVSRGTARFLRRVRALFQRQEFDV
jgi:hypothetical protein